MGKGGEGGRIVQKDYGNHFSLRGRVGHGVDILTEQRAELVITLFIAPGYVQPPLSEGAVEKKFSCDICGAVYKHAPNLTAHKKIHLGETRCDLCHKVLSRKSNFHRHLMMVHGVVMHKRGWSLQKQ